MASAAAVVALRRRQGGAARRTTAGVVAALRARLVVPAPPVDPPPIDLFEALMAYAPLLALLPGGVCADDGVIGDVLPYAVVLELPVDTQNESTTTHTNGVDTGQLQITIYAASSKFAARSLRRQVTAVLQDAPITFTSGTLLYLRDAGPMGGVKDPDKGPGGVDVWSEPLLFDYLIGR